LRNTPAGVAAQNVEKLCWPKSQNLGKQKTKRRWLKFERTSKN